MKIAVISTPVFRLGNTGLSGYGGLEQIAWLTAKGLAAKGHQIALVAPEGSECPGVQIISNGPEKTWDEKAAYNLYWQYLPQFDAIIDHSWSKWTYILKQEGVLKAPVLGVMHAPVNTMYQQLPKGIDKPCFVCISQDQANHFMALHSREARCCPNGVDLDFYKSMNIQRSKRFLFLARFSSVKSPHIAIEACKKAGVGLDLVGDTSITNEPDYLKMCQDMCDGEQIIMVGPCTRGESVWWYSQAHALLHSAKHFREPFGLAPVEAQACECPVVSFDNGAIRETIFDKHYLVKSDDDFVDRIKWLARLPDSEMKSMGVVARASASRFSTQAMTDRYEELCIDAVENRGW